MINLPRTWPYYVAAFIMAATVLLTIGIPAINNARNITVVEQEITP